MFRGIWSNMEFRLIDTGPGSGAFNMALDEAILTHVSGKRSPPTLRFYSWDPPCVSIGYFQDISKEVSLAYAKKKGYEVVRRITGGGAVFHHHELTYSIMFCEDAHLVPNNVLQSFEKVCSGIIIALKKLGIRAKFEPVNDITVNGKKISGNAETRRKGCFLQHGTIILELDLDEMFSVLNVPDSKIKDKKIADARERVTSLYDIADISDEELKDALVAGFEEALGITTREGKLSGSELEMADRLMKEKYSCDEWNHKTTSEPEE